MKFQCAVLITILGVGGSSGFAQRTVRVQTKVSASASSSRSEVANEADVARHSLALRSSAQAARFQQVAVALNLTNRQKSSIGSLVRDTRQQLAVVSSNASLSPEQQQQAEQAIKLGLSQKFVGVLTPEQKQELQALLLKKKQQQDASTSSAGSGASAPDIPSVDAPSSSDASDSQDSSSAQSSSGDAASTVSASTGVSADASASTTDSPAANSTPSVSANPTSSAPAQVANAKVDTTTTTSANPKPGRLSDAQLAALLNSFVQDSTESGTAKPSQSASGSSS